MSFSLYSVYSSLLYFILHSPLSFVGPKMALKIFLSKKNGSIKFNLFGGVRGDTVKDQVYIKVTPLETLKDDYAQDTSEH